MGDKHAPLLTQVAVENPMTETCRREYKHPFYYPITQGYINTIHVWSETQDGKIVDFKRSNVLNTVLHFRRVKV